MSEFSRGVKKFWIDVAKFKFGEVDGRAPDLRPIYSETKGFHFSGLPADEVHHIIPGSYAEANGELANSQTGLPVSRNGHRGRQATLPYDYGFNFHPDMQEAQ
jgi:alpha-glucosidase (family GH31 glycosyl hydrolase)